MVFQGGQALLQGTALPALLAGDEGPDFDAQLVQHDIFPHQGFFGEPGADSGIEIVQGFNDGEICLELHQGGEDVSRDGGGIELQPHAVGVAGHMGDFLQAEAVVQPQGGDAQHPEGGYLELLDAEELHGLRADVRDDFHAAVVGSVEDGAQIFFQRIHVSFRDVQGGEESGQAAVVGFLNQGEIFFQGVVQSGID